MTWYFIALLPSIILLEDDWMKILDKKISVLLPSIILLEDDQKDLIIRMFLVLLPSIILLEDDSFRLKHYPH